MCRIPKLKPSLANYSNTKFILSCSNIYHCGVFVNQKISINHWLNGYARIYVRLWWIEAC